MHMCKSGKSKQTKRTNQSTGEDAEQLEFTHDDDGNAKLCCHYGNEFAVWQFLIRLNIHLQCNLLLIIFLSAMLTYIHKSPYITCRSFIYSTSKVKQPKVPQVGKWINKLWHIHIVKYHSIIKRNELLIPATI